jgi:myo-inositol-1(or 4)-monophosphatase
VQPSPTNVAVEAAQQAGALLRENASDAAIVETKGRGDFVTGLDLAADELIRNRISIDFPDHHFLTEETPNRSLSARPTWIVDPIDGTLNIANRFPLFTVSIAFVEQGHPVLGVVYDPLLDDLFVAEAGKGATWNGKTIAVRDGVAWEEALLGFDLGHNDQAAHNSLALAVALRPYVAGLRLTGSAALALCYVAAGRLSGFYHHRLEPWDMAAAHLIVREAGGEFTSLEGAPIDGPQVGSVVAGSRDIAARIREFEHARCKS